MLPFQSNLPSCVASCNFLRDIYVIHPGTCPQPQATILSHNGCGEECFGDNECSLDKKCCETTCGSTCHPPLQPYRGTHDSIIGIHHVSEMMSYVAYVVLRRWLLHPQTSEHLLLCAGMPPVPASPYIRERSRGGSIDIRWNVTSSPLPATDAVLYIIEARYNVGQQHTAAAMTSWQQIAQVSLHTCIRHVFVFSSVLKTSTHCARVRVDAQCVYVTRSLTLCCSACLQHAPVAGNE